MTHLKFKIVMNLRSVSQSLFLDHLHENLAYYVEPWALVLDKWNQTLSVPSNLHFKKFSE